MPTTYRPRPRTQRAVALLLACGLLLAAPPAHADVGPHNAAQAPGVERPLRWQPHWPRFRTWQYGVTGLLVATQLYLELGPGTATGAPRVEGVLPIDQLTRDLVLLDSRSARGHVDHTSDFTWYGTLLFPIYADVVAAAWIGHGAGDLGWQLALISTQAALTVSILTRLTHLIVQRQRPVFYYAERNGERPDVDTAESLSFISGHAALAFAGAGLTCRFHEHLSLFGSPLADGLACAGTLVAAGATGVFRIMSDRHFLSDTLLAAAIGLAVGYSLPGLLHFEARKPGSRSLGVTPWASRNAGGFALVGAF